MFKLTKQIFFIVLAVSLMAACEGNSKMRAMTNSELVSKRDACMRNNPTAPGQATACENIRKECERRRGEGNYAC